MEQQLTIEMIADAFSYDITGFDCGEEALNTFLKEHLKRQHDGQILRGYALVSGDTVPRLLGYYTLSGSCFERGMLPSKTQQKKIPYQNAPSVTLGRLAIDKSLQGQGWGEMLVAHAMRVVWGASKAVGIYGLFVEALNEKAKAFYLRLGFIQLVDENSNLLFYPTKSIEQLFTDDES
ncbi:TPA: type II toxin-antitoxin system toxin KacT [Klebsiella pneumoniae]|uniref:type II toxin-antitoxin system toxin KacT n=1 Tax=Klebsiella TaxID=570 RepID=UPI0006509CED|nr:type II toxin-antitoxin system toxin KacT [Klebsiella pneumoniae]EIV7604420.1 GNAT family N-acetyltransferase [Klebsiella pneumoniae]EIW0093903.1 GNAT family N-acetyltransferase [Klebsiella pneumoniae]EIW8468335.1 GNAT family N-acetyltransferase [Klebsiella pneumoniae]EIW8500282.1 GNAT family N-acetyltransferase [Klebsiella pneumoniae]EIZ5007579.1 GNAT family N-acetyltransferase [Klebsiella pneumoniae]